MCSKDRGRCSARSFSTVDNTTNDAKGEGSDRTRTRAEKEEAAMRYQFLASIICLSIAGLGCDRAIDPFPAAPSPVLPVGPVPGPSADFPSITIGEVVRFQFTLDDVRCSGEGRCRSYNVTAPTDGRLEVELTSVSGEGTFISTTEMYVVPGGDSWLVGPGPRISVAIRARAGGTYEIRMFSAKGPSVELELRASLQ
jgi:hypothetical protein